MKNRKIILTILLVICIIAVSSVSAADLNMTDDSMAISDDNEDLTENTLVTDSVTATSQNDSLSTSKTVYFDASAGSDGDGSASNPYKYVKSDRLNQYDDLTAYFADGIYDIDSNMKISSNTRFIGQTTEKTIFNSKSDNCNFEINPNYNLELNNLTCKQISIVNHGTLKADNIIFEGKNSSLSYGGIINSNPAKNSHAYVYLNNCIFNNSYAFTGGSIYLANSTLTINNTNFSNSKAKRVGGAIYSINSTISISNSNFNSNNASYGGVMYLEKSIVDLKKLKAYNSNSYSFGGVLVFKHSDATVEDCYFKDYSSEIDAGGAIYNFRGDLIIKDSSFINGYSDFGGAICNLGSNLIIQSSRFINNTAYNYGGVIYNLYGSLNINDSFFNRSHAFEGGAIESVMTTDLTFTNNIFLNSTADYGAAIGIDCKLNQIVQYGNHFEEIYHLYLEYNTYFDDDPYDLKSNVIDYIVSNTGVYLNSYNSPEIGNYSDFVKINLTDAYYPDNTTIFRNESGECEFTARYQIEKLVDLSDKKVYINFYLKNDYGNTLKHLEYDATSGYFPYGNFSMYQKIAFTLFAHTYDAGSETSPVPSIDSIRSELAYIPSYYDGRDYGYLTPVKDQAEGGNCWAFSGIATLEACIKKITGIEYDFSEENAKNLMASFSILGLDIDTNNGGYDSMIMGYLTGWFGPVPEKSEEYDDLSSLSCVFTPEFSIQNIKFLYDSNEIKKAIMDYGAVSATFSWLNKGYHSVSLVGWDDNYYFYDSLGRYTKGAWIFKNSWGEDWWENGFGYLAYDTTFITNNFRPYTFVFNKSDSYLYSHQYDYSGANNYIVTNGHVFYKNTFKIDHQIEWIRAFSTYFLVPTNYTVTLYKNGALASSQSGYSDPGYYTIPFNDRITAFKGDEITIIIENYNDGKNYVPVCCAEKLTTSIFNPNSSFISYDGEHWQDLYDLDYPTYLKGPSIPHSSQAACIKVFSMDYFFNYWGIYTDISEFESVEIGQEITINVTFTPGDYNFDSIRRINGSLVDFNIDGKTYYAKVNNGKASLKISFDKVGFHTLKANYINNLFESEELAFNFTVVKKATTLSANSVSKVYGGNEKSVITLKDSKGKRISNAIIKFNTGGSPTTVKTNGDGVATLNLNLVPKSYTVTITYAGSGTYAASTAKMKIVIKKATPKITADKKTFKKKVKTKKYTVTLKNNQGKIIKNAKMTINVNGKTYTATTNAKGQATFKITKLTKKGNHKVTIKYAGNAYYNAVSRKVTITVK